MGYLELRYICCPLFIRLRCFEFSMKYILGCLICLICYRAARSFSPDGRMDIHDFHDSMNPFRIIVFIMISIDKYAHSTISQDPAIFLIIIHDGL